MDIYVDVRQSMTIRDMAEKLGIPPGQFRILGGRITSRPDLQLTRQGTDYGFRVDLALVNTEVSQAEIDAFMAREDIQAMLGEVLDLHFRLQHEAMVALNIDMVETPETLAEFLHTREQAKQPVNG